MSLCPRCKFENPAGFAFCGHCGAPLTQTQLPIGKPSQPSGLTGANFDHLRAYLPPQLVEALRFDPISPPLKLLEECLDHLTDLLAIIVTHLPVYLIERLFCQPVAGRADGQFLTGTLIFADISGFTAMSERLSHIGREGAEEITAIVNRYFRSMLAILRAHRGQLIKFGGDALLGLFLEPESTTRAVQAAMQMQATMSEFTQVSTSQGVFPLRMKVGVHKGRFFAAQLGTTEGMEYALLGKDVNRTAITESAAVAGQVLLDADTVQAISVPCRATPAPQNPAYLVVEEIASAPPHPTDPTDYDPLHRLPTLEPHLDDLQRAVAYLDAVTPYLPAGLLTRIVGSFSAGFTRTEAITLEGEHRLVSNLFANIHGLGEIVDRLGPGRESEIVSAINRYFTATANSIRRFGGTINKMDLYDQGDKLLAIFGAPVAHEDDAERAIRAALAIQHTIPEINHELSTQAGLADLRLAQRVGISTGYVFAGYVGTDWRHEYTVMGDEVNLAARLMSVARPGTILVSSDIRRKVQALFDLMPQGEVRLKGKSAPVPVFTVEKPRAVPEPLRGIKGMRSPLVGRGDEWERLLQAIARLRDGQGQIISVVGEAGLGKSRLIAELRQQCTGNDSPPPTLTWIEGRCLSYTEAVSFRLFQEIVQKIVGVQPDDSEAEAWSKLRAIWAEIQKTQRENSTFRFREEILPYIANFLNLSLPPAFQEKVRYLDAEALQRRTFVAIHSLLNTLATPERPLVIVMDDLQWIDQASTELLNYSMSLVETAPIMLILLYRPERSKRCWQIHERIHREFLHHALEILLQPLKPSDSQQLLTNLVNIEDWPSSVQNMILDRTEGNPLYVEEVIRTLIDDHILVQTPDERWQINQERVRDLESFTVPDTLQGVLMARLDRLEEPCRLASQLAAVIGRVFSFDILAHIVPENGAKLTLSLVRLQQHETIRETQRVPEIVYTFKHALMQEVCYRSLLARIRRFYHRQIAGYIEQYRSTGHRDVESNIPLIAHHAFAGCDWPRALKYQMLAGRQAQKLFANQEAIDHFQKALQSAQEIPAEKTIEQRCSIHTALGEVLITTSQYDTALNHLGEALNLSVAQGATDHQAIVCNQLARLYELRGEYSLAFEWIEQGLAALAGEENTIAAELLLRAGFINTRQGQYDLAFEQCQHGLRIAEGLGELSTLARAYNLLGHIARLRGQSTQAIEHFQHAFTLHRQAGDLHGQATMHNQIANAYFDMGQWQKAEDHYRQARSIFDQMGDLYLHAVITNNLGGIARNQGRLTEALMLYQDGLKTLERIGGSPWVLGVFHMNIGATLIRLDQLSEALQHLNICQDYYQQAQARDFLPEMHRYFAEVALRRDDLATALDHAEQALQLARTLDMRGEEGIAMRLLGEIALAQADLERAQKYLQDGLALLREIGDEYEAACSQLIEAKIALAMGNWEAADDALEQCTSVFQQLNASYDLELIESLRFTTRHID